MDRSQQFTQVLHDWTEVFMRRSMRDFMSFTKKSGLSMSQLSVMMRLYHRGPCGVSEIGEHLGVTNAAASQLVDRLVQMELLERSEDIADRRIRNLTLTEKGQAILLEGINFRRRWMEELTTALSLQEQEQIITALTSLTSAARKLDESQEFIPSSAARKQRLDG